MGVQNTASKDWMVLLIRKDGGEDFEIGIWRKRRGTEDGRPGDEWEFRISELEFIILDLRKKIDDERPGGEGLGDWGLVDFGFGEKDGGLGTEGGGVEVWDFGIGIWNCGLEKKDGGLGTEDGGSGNLGASMMICSYWGFYSTREVGRQYLGAI